MSQGSLEERLTISKRELAQLLKELKKWSAPATVLLSLYIPPGRPLSDVMTLLRQEYSITDNIKLKKTRQAVKRALSAAMDRLQMLTSTPPNGLVLFCGEDMSTGKFECFMFSPPESIRVFYYRTDKRFITDFLEDMVEDSNAIGIIIVERDQATIGLLKGARLEVLKELEGFVPGKHKMGGQSQRRYERIIEQMVDEFFKKVGEEASNLLVPLVEKGVLKGVIVAGPGLAKQEFVEGNYLDYRLKKILAPELVDVAYQGLQGLKEAVMKAEKVVEAQMYRDAVNAMEEFKLHLAKGTGMIVYGEKDVEAALEMGAVKTLLIHESREDLEEWVEKAKSSGAQVIVVPESLAEAEWFLKTFGGLAGILRFRISTV
ncbi:peptide chain release factor subunit 1 [Aeropyrum pernix]|uniref:Peptide chain release factor subunit 1 n=1 Tax=Aeropyrum pernix TaxID=56636 RepID=A0A401H7W4_AERPX|nr:peptide chain release factor aRF-1 [Aeropyrum pernix]GBF08470.1 peptide chain release factor subunit 1 [Aeropyrum pernix]